MAPHQCTSKKSTYHHTRSTQRVLTPHMPRQNLPFTGVSHGAKTQPRKDQTSKFATQRPRHTPPMTTFLASRAGAFKRSGELRIWMRPFIPKMSVMTGLKGEFFQHRGSGRWCLAALPSSVFFARRKKLRDKYSWHETDQGEPAGAFPTISWASICLWELARLPAQKRLKRNARGRDRFARLLTPRIK